MDPFAARRVRAAYDEVADDYVEAFADDLASLPVDLAVLDAAAASMVGDGVVLDLGCGPGQVGQRLAARGRRVVGVDLSPGMLRAGRWRSPLVRGVAGDMRSLPIRSRSCAGAVAFYSVQHVPRAVLPSVFAEVRRVVAPGSPFVVATHLGDGDVFFTELLGHTFATVGGAMYARDELLGLVSGASFSIESVRERGPLPHEHPSQRIYITARAE